MLCGIPNIAGNTKNVNAIYKSFWHMAYSIDQLQSMWNRAVQWLEFYSGICFSFDCFVIKVVCSFRVNESFLWTIKVSWAKEVLSERSWELKRTPKSSIGGGKRVKECWATWDHVLRSSVRTATLQESLTLTPRWDQGVGLGPASPIHPVGKMQGEHSSPWISYRKINPRMC